jgi:pimeloyl-ACP methyl ester carboxylesterase
VGGQSDRFTPGTAPTLEEMADDVLAVMEATSTTRATILAVQDGTFTALLLAAPHPYLVRRTTESARGTHVKTMEV